MSGERVDVLAELRTTYCSPESYAAVAELIKAVDDYRHTIDEALAVIRSGESLSGPMLDQKGRAMNHMFTALSRIQPDGHGS